MPSPWYIIGAVAFGFLAKVVYDKTGIDLLSIITGGKTTEKEIEGTEEEQKK